ncbi:MAG: sulfotransferase domain-containing protein [Bacteroidales bacterium]|nr:sulfotransferase domain-containing protein [Bacteroidales bacterium]
MKDLSLLARQAAEVLHLSRQYNAGRTAARKKLDGSEDKVPVKRKNNFQLISLHIPKSGGTSFYKTIQGVYGKDVVARVDYKPYYKKLFLNEREYEKSAFSNHLKVIHGHIQFNALKKHIELSDDVKIITWLRNPVERIISDYFFVKNIMNERYRHDPYNPHVLNRMTRSLLEFAAQEVEQNRISRFLGDARLEDFFFVGVLEYFDEDLKRLSALLNWGPYSEAKLNKTKNKPKEIADEIVEKIKEFNRKDMDLYEKILALRKNRG